MFTQTRPRGLRDRVFRSPLLDLLTGPHGVDRYTELVTPTWTFGEARAKVVAVRRQNARSVTLTLKPNHVFTGFRAGQHINLTVEIDGRRRTRCYSPASAEGDELIELTVGRHDGGLVSTYLCDHAHAGMVVGLDSVGGDFTLPADRPRRILFIAGGSGITPVLSMVRTLSVQRHTGDVAVIHYTRSAAEACYRDELAALPGVRVLRGYTRDCADTDLTGRFCAEHLAAALPGAGDDAAVFVCGPPGLAAAVRAVRPDALAESFVPPTFVGASSGGRVSFADSGVAVTDDGRPLLEQAEAAGLTPESGCRMGICHSCTRRKTSGVVKNLITGAVSRVDSEDVQICVSAPVGDVEIAL